MTTMVYNDVILKDCETLSFVQDIEYDASNTDVMFSRFRIRVASTLVAVRAVSGFGNGNPWDRQFAFGIDTQNGTTVVQRMHDVHAKLSEPRGNFWFLVDQCPQDERQGNGFSLPILDQPLLIACGIAYEEEVVTDTVNSVAVNRIERTPLHLKPHPFSDIDDSSTREYGDEELFNAPDVLDCDNGPKPKRVNITKIMGGRAFRVEFEIEVCRKICSEQFEDAKPILQNADLTESGKSVLSNRWSIDESKDDNWVTTRSLQGTLRVANYTIWPHAMRWLCIPPLLRGYKRSKQSFVSDEANLTLKYRIDDVQAHAAPPYPAIKWSGHHAESASGANGIVKGGEFRIRLQGAPGVDKQQLIAVAGKVAVNRIRGLNPKPDVDGNRTYALILQNASIVDVLDEPVIEMRVQVRYTDASFKSLALRVKNMGSSLDTLDGHEYGYDPELDPYLIAGYNPRVWPVPLAYDSETPAGIFHCYLQHPCSIWHDVPDGLFPNDDADPVEPPGSIPDVIESGRADGSKRFSPNGPTPDLYPEQELPEDDTDLSEDEDIYNFPYTFIELQNRYVVNNGWVQIPLATTDPEAPKTASLIKLHGRTARRVLTMRATREGKPPTIPSLVEDIVDQNGCREVLKMFEVIAKAPQLLADGTGRRFEVFTEHTYLMERAPRNNQILRGASSPLDLYSPDSNSLDLSEIADTGGHLQWENGVTTTYPVSP